MRRSGWGTGAALGIALAAAAGTASAEPRPTPWAQFRGPDGQGVSAEKGLPDDWSVTRNVLWKTPIPGRGHSSPVAFDGKILLSSMEGDTFVIRAGPVHEVLKTNTLGEAMAASPALAQGRIFIRGESHLYAIGPRS